MRFFDLLNLQHVALYIFPTLVFIVLFWLALGYSHFESEDSEERMERVHATFPEGIEDRDAPFPLALILIILGTFVWGVAYILGYGLLEVRI